MLRRKGQIRTYEDNLQLAAFLSFTAGCVNVSGFIAFDVLTTNITGHVAFFAKWLSFGDVPTAFYFLAWMLLFLIGSFISALLVEWVGSKSPRFAHAIPILIEASILFFVGSYSHLYYEHTDIQIRFLGGSLLFAMGFQNAMVTKISGSVVRTTHLTGMTTDLGIELAALLRNAKGINKKDLKKKILLQSTIIFFFFAGGICGGYAFQELLFHAFYLPAGILMITLFYDTLRHGGFSFSSKDSH
ncbi:MAG: YoaK family protein [Flammeovirgaceae bacterium]